jgi:hypothetical protein
MALIRLGTTAHLQITWTDVDGTALTPDTQSWIVEDPEGIVQGSTTSPTQVEGSDGVYYYNFDIPSDNVAGIWTLKATATVSGRTGKCELGFHVYD